MLQICQRLNSMAQLETSDNDNVDDLRKCQTYFDAIFERI